MVLMSSAQISFLFFIFTSSFSLNIPIPTTTMVLLSSRRSLLHDVHETQTEADHSQHRQLLRREALRHLADERS